MRVSETQKKSANEAKTVSSDTIHTEQADDHSEASSRQVFKEKGDSTSEETVCLYLYDTSKADSTGKAPLKLALVKNKKKSSKGEVLENLDEVVIYGHHRESNTQAGYKAESSKQSNEDNTTKQDKTPQTRWLLMLCLNLLLALLAVFAIVYQVKRNNNDSK